MRQSPPRSDCQVFHSWPLKSATGGSYHFHSQKHLLLLSFLSGKPFPPWKTMWAVIDILFDHYFRNPKVQMQRILYLQNVLLSLVLMKSQLWIFVLRANQPKNTKTQLTCVPESQYNDCIPKSQPKIFLVKFYNGLFLFQGQQECLHGWHWSLLVPLQMFHISHGSLFCIVLSLHFHFRKNSPLHKLPLLPIFYLDNTQISLAQINLFNNLISFLGCLTSTSNLTTTR